MVVPRNGLGNRLQAWSSAAILARAWQVPIDVLWEPQPAAPTPFEPLFAAPAKASEPHQGRIHSAELTALLGGEHDSFPRYLWVDQAKSVVFLAGHDRGEQPFMDELVQVVGALESPCTLVIVAGGLFHLPTDGFTGGDFISERRAFYSTLQWSGEVLDELDALHPTNPYVGLHIRQTDRSREAPRARDIRAALQHLRDTSQVDSLFVAADTEEGLRMWSEYGSRIGFQPWSADVVNRTRSASDAGVSAAVDWLLLSRAADLVFPQASTFSAEAAVAAGMPGISLSASNSVQRARGVMAHARNVVSYPWRKIRSHP